jgi:hypothetical protein
MPGSEDYRKYVEKCFGTIDEKLDMVIDQMTKANHRVSKLEDKSNERQVVIDDFRHLEKDFNCVKQKVEEIDKSLLEVWFFKKYPKVFIGIIAAAVLATFGMSFFNKKDMKEIRTKVNWIEAYEKIPYAPTRGAIMAYPDTLTKK